MRPLHGARSPTGISDYTLRPTLSVCLCGGFLGLTSSIPQFSRLGQLRLFLPLPAQVHAFHKVFQNFTVLSQRAFSSVEAWVPPIVE